MHSAAESGLARMELLIDRAWRDLARREKAGLDKAGSGGTRSGTARLGTARMELLTDRARYGWVGHGLSGSGMIWHVMARPGKVKIPRKAL